MVIGYKTQTELSSRLIEIDDLDFTKTIKENDCRTQWVKYIKGIDLSFSEDNEEDAVASLIVLKYLGLEVSVNLVN